MTTDPDEAYLATQLISKNFPVTYHTFSRARSIHVNQAKVVLYNFYLKNKSTLQAKFIIVGEAKSETGSKKVIKLSSDVESDKSEFLSISTVHIYSLVTDKVIGADLTSEELKFPSNLQNLEDYQRCGMIKGPPIIKSETALPIPAPIAPIAKPKPSVNVGREAPKVKEEKPKSSGLLSNYTSRKGQAANNVAKSATKRKIAEVAAPKYEYKSRKEANKERVVVSHEQEDDEGEEAEDDRGEGSAEIAVASSIPKGDTNLATMFDDDWSDFGDEDETKKTEQPKSVEPESQEISSEVVVSEIDETPKETTHEPMFVEDEEEEEPVKTTVDEDGYFTSAKKTKPSTKPVRPAKPATRPGASTSKPAPKSKAKVTGKKQATLASFFGQN